MLGVLLGDNGQVADLESVIAGEILQGTLVILGDLVGDESGHGDEVYLALEVQCSVRRGGREEEKNRRRESLEKKKVRSAKRSDGQVV